MHFLVSNLALKLTCFCMDFNLFTYFFRVLVVIILTAKPAALKHQSGPTNDPAKSRQQMSASRFSHNLTMPHLLQEFNFAEKSITIFAQEMHLHRMRSNAKKAKVGNFRTEL